MSDKHAAQAVDTKSVASTASSSPKNENSQAQLQTQTDSSSRTKPHADPGLRWGITPSTNPDDQSGPVGRDECQSDRGAWVLVEGRGHVYGGWLDQMSLETSNSQESRRDL